MLRKEQKMTKELKLLLAMNPGSEVVIEYPNGSTYRGEYQVTVLYLPKDKKGQLVIDTTNMECSQLDSETLEIRTNRALGGVMSLICYAKRKK